MLGKPAFTAVDAMIEGAGRLDRLFYGTDDQTCFEQRDHAEAASNLPFRRDQLRN